MAGKRSASAFFLLLRLSLRLLLKLMLAAFLLFSELALASEGEAAVGPNADVNTNSNVNDSLDLDQEIAAQQQASEELKQQIQRYNDTAKKKAQQERGLLERITGLRQDSEMAQQQIRLLELQKTKLQNSVAFLSREMSYTSRKVDELLLKLRGRLVNMYKYGSHEELSLLLSAESTHDAVCSAYLLERLARHDQAEIDELLSKITELERLKKNLDANRSQLLAQTEVLGLQQKKYDVSLDETNAVLSDIRKERRKAEAVAKEIEQAQQEIGHTILEMTQRKEAKEAPEPAPRVAPAPHIQAPPQEPLQHDFRSQLPQAQPQTQLQPQPETQPQSEAQSETQPQAQNQVQVQPEPQPETPPQLQPETRPAESAPEPAKDILVQTTPLAAVQNNENPAQTAPAMSPGALLDWPLSGKIITGYGIQAHPTLGTKSFNSGINIGAEPGAFVKAAGPGKVLFEGWVRGYGQVVIIGHGENLSTVYGHLASTRVKTEDFVQAGTVVGTVGNTGTIEEYSLHFEVRVREAAKNPLNYLKKT